MEVTGERKMGWNGMFARLSLGLVAAALSSLPATAAASQAPERPVGLSVTIDEGEVLWVEATVGAGTSPVDLKILTPRKNGHRRVFQRCSFAAVGAGTYRCGLDVGSGSIAGSLGGDWAARAVGTGKTVLGRLTFSLAK